MRQTLSVFLSCILLAGSGASAQQVGQNSAGPATQATFTTTSQLVIETVTVKDKNGNPVLGLTKDNFTVTEDGKPQVIKFFEFQKLDDTPAAPLLETRTAEAGQTTEKPPEKPKVESLSAGQIAGEAPGVTRYKDHRLLAMYFDMTAMPVPDQLRALAAAEKFIKTQMSGPDLMCVMEYAGEGVKLLSDFTDDREALLATLDKLIIGEGQGFDQTDTSAAAADTGAAFGQDDSEFNIFYTDRQLAALQTAVKQLGTLNEKKNLIFFASGLNLNGTDNQAQLHATVNAAIRADVVFYPIDARGLIAASPLGDATRGSQGRVSMYTGAAAVAVTTNLQQSQDTLYALASDTGGKAFLDYNDLSLGIVQAQKAIESYYLIGYYSTNTALDGKFRKISIKLDNGLSEPDYRHGYYAGKEYGKFTTADRDRQLEDALMLADPVTDITIAMEIDHFELNGAEYFVPIMVKIPGSELTLARKGGAEITRLDFIWEVKDNFGSTYTNNRDHMDIKLSDTAAAELAKRPIQYGSGFTLLPGSYKIKFLARDFETGRMGTYERAFVIPNLAKEEKRVPISSVVLSSQRVDIKDALFTAAKDKGASEQFNPLVLDGQKLIPSVTRVFSKTKDMYIYLQAYERGQTTQQPLVAFVAFYRGQTKAFETPPLSVTEGMNPKSKAVPMRFSVALGKLPPGEYNCQVTVLDPGGNKAAFWQAPVTLIP